MIANRIHPPEDPSLAIANEIARQRIENIRNIKKYLKKQKKKQNKK